MTDKLVVKKTSSKWYDIELQTGDSAYWMGSIPVEEVHTELSKVMRELFLKGEYLSVVDEDCERSGSND